MWLVDLNYNFESDWLSKLSDNMCLFFKSKFFKQASQQVADYSNHLDSIIQIKVGGGGWLKISRTSVFHNLFLFRLNALGGLLESLSVLEIVRNR